MFGVLTSALPSQPMALARIWSGRMSRMFGRPAAEADTATKNRAAAIGGKRDWSEGMTRVETGRAPGIFLEVRLLGFCDCRE